MAGTVSRFLARLGSRLVAISCGLTLATVAKTAAQWTVLADQRSVEEAHLARLQRGIDLFSTPAAAKTNMPGIFIQDLPESTAPRVAVATVQQSASAVGASLLGIQSQTRQATAAMLGRQELTLTLGGTYPGQKQLLGEILARSSNGTLTRLTFRRGLGPEQVDATVAIVFWSAPLAAGAPKLPAEAR